MDFYSPILIESAGSNPRGRCSRRYSFGKVREKPLSLEGVHCSQENQDVLLLRCEIRDTENPSVGSNEAGYKWLKNIVGDRYTVKRIRLVESVLHLDCVLSVPRSGLAIVCEEAFIDGLPEEIKDWDLIRVSLDDVKRLAVNGLPVDSQNYVLSYNLHNDNRFIQTELERRGIKVHRVFFGTHNGQGGSLRCATQPLKREVKTAKTHESQGK